jgi:transcriptional regulator with XRE-family HTH domain
MLRPLVTGGGDRERRARPLLRTMLGAALRRARQTQGRTLADVARSAKVSMQYLSELERGRKEASSEVLAAICNALRIDLPDLLTEVGRRLAEAQGSRVIRLGSTGFGSTGFGSTELGSTELGSTELGSTGSEAEVLQIADGSSIAPPSGVQDRSGDAVCLLAA